MGSIRKHIRCSKDWRKQPERPRKACGLIHVRRRRENGTTSVRVPGYIACLQQRGLARAVDQQVMMSWFNTLQTREMAAWACEVAKQIALAVLSFIPDDPVPGRDPSTVTKQLWRGVQQACRPAPSRTQGPSPYHMHDLGVQLDSIARKYIQDFHQFRICSQANVLVVRFPQEMNCSAAP
jgi:hypothetical protein